MRFDWPKFLRAQGIPFVSSGPNTARGNVNIKCVYCGENDPSEHMGLNPAGWWGCLRNASHRGKTPPRLIAQLLRISEAEARRFVDGAASVAPSTDTLSASLAALRRTVPGGEVSTPPPRLAYPKEFKPLDNGSILAEQFWAYLEGRGYREAQIRWLAKTYDLKYATTGLYAGRIIVPITDRYGKIQSWTARAISANATPRYRTLRMKDEDGDGGPVAELPANHTVLGLPALYGCENPRVLILVEGPFDALKLCAFGHSYGVWATSLFGLNAYPQQVAVLQEICPRFEKVYLLLDEDAVFQRLRVLKALAGLSISTLKMPPNTDDPGAMSAQEVAELSLRLVRELM